MRNVFVPLTARLLCNTLAFVLNVCIFRRKPCHRVTHTHTHNIPIVRKSKRFAFDCTLQNHTCAKRTRIDIYEISFRSAGLHEWRRIRVSQSTFRCFFVDGLPCIRFHLVAFPNGFSFAWNASHNRFRIEFHIVQITDCILQPQHARAHTTEKSSVCRLSFPIHRLISLSLKHTTKKMDLRARRKSKTRMKRAHRTSDGRLCVFARQSNIIKSKLPIIFTILCAFFTPWAAGIGKRRFGKKWKLKWTTTRINIDSNEIN